MEKFIESLTKAIKELPEVYQPVFNHPDLSEKTSRNCEDRLVWIKKIHDDIYAKINSNSNEKRKLKILDLGCAQGFISCTIASWGAEVCGVDFLDKNINVCNLLAEENKDYALSFECGDIKEKIHSLEKGEFDIVLGLSVFHHLCNANGFEETRELLKELSEKTAAGIFELAQKEEPLYWAQALPEIDTDLISGFDFTYCLANFPTHLSEIERPLYYASSEFAYFENFGVVKIEKTIFQSHKHNGNCFGNTRRYFIGEDKFIKSAKIKIKNEVLKRNEEEVVNEKEFLDEMSGNMGFPKVLHYENRFGTLYLVRKSYDGELLSEAIENEVQIDRNSIIKQLLEKLAELERIGYYHNDLRTWNLIYQSDGKIQFIDFGDFKKEYSDCAFPYNPALSFFLFLDELEGTSARVSPARNVKLLSSLLEKFEPSAVEEILQMRNDKKIFSSLNEFFCDSKNKKTSFNCNRHLNVNIERQLLCCYENTLDQIISWIKSIWDNSEWHQQQITSFQQQTSGLQQQTSGLQQQTNGLQQQTNGLQQQTNELQQQTNELRQQTSGLQQQTNGLQQQTNELQQQTNELRQQTSAFQQQTNELQQQTSAFQQQTSELQQQTSGLQQQTNELQQQTNGLQQQITSLQQQMDLQNNDYLAYKAYTENQINNLLNLLLEKVKLEHDEIVRLNSQVKALVNSKPWRAYQKICRLLRKLLRKK